MDLHLSGKIGTSAELITKKIKKDGERQIGRNKNRKPEKLKNSFQKGFLSTKDLKSITMGIEMLWEIACENFDNQYSDILRGDKDVSVIKKEVLTYRNVMGDFVRRIRIGTREEYHARRKIELLTDCTEIVQAARDSVLLKKETRHETVNGEEKDIIYDVAMLPTEVIDIIYNYVDTLDRLQFEKLRNLTGLGLGFAGTVGVMFKSDNESKRDGKGKLITLASSAIGGLKVIQGILEEGKNRDIWDIEDEQYRLRNDLLENEQISKQAEIDAIKEIQRLTDQQRYLENKRDNKELLFELATDLAVVLIAGLYINKEISIKENGKIDGKTLASALATIGSLRGVTRHFVNAISGFQSIRNSEIEFKALLKKVDEIMVQMEKKVYPLEGAKQPFNSIRIENFKGNFYPKTNYETNEIEFGFTLTIPEFSAKRGDVVLLSGESGSGKSTFLRLLKRGDINNQRCIKLDNNQEVDNLGDEYISFRPSIDLGGEKNVLFQITGKQNISDLNEIERQNLIDIMGKLNLKSTNLLEELASKKFIEFSTGQQRRLALSKLFFRINDGTSVIIVDEPVGNVEDRLIREQLEMIRNYAMERNVILILTTHRLDLAQDLATKRYHITEDGVLIEIPIQEQEQKIDNRDRGE